ncbi:MAG: dolichyl-phosphate-mannose-protein mannosyltransferase [Parcubacteria group bacterium Gr01-1014_106]|nr:MAG: dolichyl-phosphate-mannose-protein mannosyltransferase [Parcubacteria group bacterium Gr01-1014_106]
MLAASAREVVASLRARPFILAACGIAALVLLPRLVDLGSVLTVDEPLWQARAHQFVEAIATGQIRKTAITGQPGITAMWIAGLAVPWNSLAISQAAIATAVTIVSLANIVLLRRLAGTAVAVAAGVLMALDPFFIAHSRVVHTDALLASFMLLTLLCLLCAWHTRERRYVAYAGIAAALTGLTKLFGLFVLLPAALTILFAPRAHAASSSVLWKGTLRRFGVFALPFIITFLLLWPVLLVSPRTPLAFITQRVTLHAQEAAVGSGGGDTWYYPREFARRLSLGVSVLFGAALSMSEQKSDRYMLIAHLATDIASGAALVWIAHLLAGNNARQRVLLTAVLVGSAGGLMARDLLQLHPYTMGHWNRLLPIPANAKLGWGEGLDQAAAYLRSLNRPASELTTASYYPGVLAHFLPGVRVERFTQYESADYRFVVLYRSMYGRDRGSYETAALQQFLGADPQEGMIREVDGARFRLEKIVWVDRLPFVWVFQRLPKTPT